MPRLPICYVQVRGALIVGRVVGTGRTAELQSVLALDSEGRLAALGREAIDAVCGVPDLALRRGFCDGEPWIEDWDLVEIVLRYFLSLLRRGGIGRRLGLQLRHRLILHPVGRSVSDSEALRLVGCGQATGARETFIWSGGVLSDQQILSGRFGADRWVGEKPGWIRPRARRPFGVGKGKHRSTRPKRIGRWKQAFPDERPLGVFRCEV